MKDLQREKIGSAPVLWTKLLKTIWGLWEMLAKYMSVIPLEEGWLPVPYGKFQIRPEVVGIVDKV